ncbi:MAG: glycoside hydrolase family 32 protein [Planctomycetaceae bacterium]|nr:glycoside hydrolase family 32 protein [Planctomycetaceae bacterium]
MSQTFRADMQIISDEELHTARHVRQKLLRDPYRPTYHFVCPEGLAMPFDPNGNIFWRGRHHMGYIYQERGVHFWGHVSSTDLLHWRHHQPCLFPTLDSPETGIFSGNAYLDKDGKRVLMMYHGCGAGNSMAWSDDKDLEVWHKMPGNPIVPNPPEPDKVDYQSWDPCGWIVGDTYYAVFGGGKNTVWKSKDLKSWTKCGPFLAKAYPGIDIHEDISCPDFFPMGDKWVMVCISHRLGTRYYVGHWENDQLVPEYHEMMSYSDNEFFAPESHTDAQGRRILISWVFDGRNDMVRNFSGWSGTMSLPRVMKLGSDNRMLMTPIDEAKTLRYNGKSSANVAIAADGQTVVPFDCINDNVMEIELEIEPQAAKEYGVKVCCSADGKHETVIGYDTTDGTLGIDRTHAGPDQRIGRSVIGTERKSRESAPLKLAAGETLKLRIFIDRSLVEVFANDGRMALSRAVYPQKGSTLIKLYAKGGAAKARSVSVWDMMPTNPY